MDDDKRIKNLVSKIGGNVFAPASVAPLNELCRIAQQGSRKSLYEICVLFDPKIQSLIRHVTDPFIREELDEALHFNLIEAVKKSSCQGVFGSLMLKRFAGVIKDYWKKRDRQQRREEYYNHENDQEDNTAMDKIVLTQQGITNPV